MIIITKDPIDIQTVMEYVKDNAAGAISIFIGNVRNHNSSGSVSEILYEAYEKMAEEVMAKIETETLEKWKLRRFIAIHRIGKLKVGETSVVVAVSSGHRREAFDACNYGIDNIKDRVPIWKKEISTTSQKWAEGKSLVR
ncbi:MAG: molybdenum cofactor biosynthesis protein MoaE [Nitrososphaeraceae archaeon]